MTRIKVLYFVSAILSIALIISCGSQASAPPAGSGNMEGYDVSAIAGSEMSRAVKMEGELKRQEGYTLNGNKTGTWLTYHSDGRIKMVESFVNNQLDGVQLELDQRGQIIKKAYYQSGQLDGPSSTYKFGRPQEIIPYRMGTVDGTVQRFYVNGKKMEEIQFKSGKQDGYYRHYNEQEQMDLEYVYKNGEKVSGGMVDPSQSN